MTTVGAVMTSFNRRETTLRAMEGLAAQRLPDDVELLVVLTDDGSSDGTASAVREQFPTTVVLEGDGSLYWTGGTLSSETEALRRGADYLLWLNDDVELESDAVAVLLDVARRDRIAVGAVADPDSGAVSYGGHRRRRSCAFPLDLVIPDGTEQRVDTMNGNVVLIPASVRARVGGLEARMRHNMADLDFGLRASRVDVTIALAPLVVGRCRRNAQKQSWADPSHDIGWRLRSIISVKGLPPVQWLKFTRRYCGWRWPRYFVGPYLRALTCGLRRRAT